MGLIKIDFQQRRATLLESVGRQCGSQDDGAQSLCPEGIGTKYGTLVNGTQSLCPEGIGTKYGTLVNGTSVPYFKKSIDFLFHSYHQRKPQPQRGLKRQHGASTLLARSLSPNEDRICSLGEIGKHDRLKICSLQVIGSSPIVSKLAW